jgi:hypothetical protein
MPCEVFTNWFACNFVHANNLRMMSLGLVVWLQVSLDSTVKGSVYHTFTKQILCCCHCCGHRQHAQLMLPIASGCLISSSPI